MSEIRSSRDRPPLIGSQHIYSDGYGYGMRYPTERNQMTLPANVAKHRHPPDSDRFLSGMRSTQVIKKDEHSLRRNAEQIVYQTSGEIGFHTIGFDPEPVRLNKRATHQHAKLYHSPVPPSFTVTSLSPAKNTTQTMTQTMTATQTQSQSNNSNYSNNNNSSNETLPVRRERETYSAQSSARISSARSDWTSASRNNDEFRSYQRDERPPPRTASGISSRNTGFTNTESSKNRYLETLHSLDSAFARQSRRDLFTASLPPKPQHELVWLATANNRAALQSKPWENKLRREPNS